MVSMFGLDLRFDRCGFVLWCSVGLFYGGCGFVGGGCAVLALDCVFFFFFGIATGVCGCGYWLVGRR